MGIRNARKDANDFMKSAKADGLSEDLTKDGEAQIQAVTDSYVKQIGRRLSREGSGYYDRLRPEFAGFDPGFFVRLGPRNPSWGWTPNPHFAMRVLPHLSAE